MAGSPSRKLVADQAAIAATFRAFVQPGEIGECRILCGEYMSGFYFAHDEIEIAAKLAADAGKTAKAIYVVMNRINRSLQDRPRLVESSTLTKDEDIGRRLCVLIDFDPCSNARGADDSSTDQEKEAARQVMEAVLEWLLQHGFPEPTAADSGNGYHLVLGVDLPNDDATKALIKKFLETLATRFSIPEVAVDTSVHNASRITKCYGCPVRKGVDRPERPHRLSKVLTVGDGTASQELIEAVISEGTLLESTSEQSGNLAGIELAKPPLELPTQFPVGGRHETLVKVAGAVRSFGSNEAEIYEILQTFNRTRCANGKPDEELQKIARDFAKKDSNLSMKALIECSNDDQFEKAQRQQSLKLALEHSMKGLREGKDLVDIVNRLSVTLGTLQQDSDTFVEITAMSAGELDAAEFEQNDLIEDVMVEGQPCIVAAPKKCLKTNIMCDAALSLNSGDKFLNTFYVPKPQRVAMLSGESGKKTLQETLRRIARTKQRPFLADHDNLFVGFDLPNFGNSRSMKSLRDFVRRHRIEVLIVDPAYLSIPLGDSAGNLFLVGQILQPFSKMAQDEGFTPVIVHHFVKAAAVTESPPDMESIAWAGFTEWMRQWILLSRRSRYDADNPGHHELWFAAGGSAGHSVAKAIDIDEGSRKHAGGRRWDVIVKPVGEAIEESVDAKEQVKEHRLVIKAQKQREKDLRAVENVLTTNPTGLSYTKTREYSRVKDARLDDVLAELLANKTIVTCTVIGGNKQPYDGYRLASVSPAQSTDDAGIANHGTPSVPLPGFPIHRGTGADGVSVPDVGESHLKPNGQRKARIPRKTPA